VGDFAKMHISREDPLSLVLEKNLNILNHFQNLLLSISARREGNG